MRKISVLVAFLAIVFSCTPKKYKSLEDGLYAEIQTNKGDILLELYYKDVPMTVANFVSLADGTNNQVPDSIKGKDFYDGIRFHRVVNNFVIQGGDPTETGRGTPGYRFGDEFTYDSEGNLMYKHDDQGIMSMANGGPNSNGSQFFITHRPIPHLDGKHSVFGKTIVNSDQLAALQQQNLDSVQLQKGIDSLRMEVVNKIAKLDTILDVKIIRIGSDAKSFEAAEILDNELASFADKQKEQAKQAQEAEEKRYSKYLSDREAFYKEMNEAEAKKYDNGLGVLILKDNPKGKKVPQNKRIQSHFVLYTADGKKIQSTRDSGQPFVFQLDDAQRPMITGFKEGVSKLRIGETARLFIPYSIGFGKDKYGPFPAKSDLIFEIEIIDIQ